MFKTTTSTPAKFCDDETYFKVNSHSSVCVLTASVADLCDAGIAITFDVETTGQTIKTSRDGTRKKNAMVELGAVATLLCAPSFVLGVFEGFMGVPEDAEWDPICVSEFWDSNEKLRDRKKLIESCTNEASPVMEDFVKWVQTIKDTCRDQYHPERTILFYSDNPAFDIKWIDSYIEEFTNYPYTMNTFFGGKFSQVIDTSSYAAGLAHTSGTERLKKENDEGFFSDDTAAAQFLRIDKSELPSAEDTVPHRAAHDALQIITTHTFLAAYAKTGGKR